jgi:Family of unknown function (DUF6111)
MIRIVLENVLLFLLPTLAYLGFMALRRRAGNRQSAQDVLDEAPLVWLFAAGAILMMVGVAYFATSSGGKPGQGYQPPIYRDGRVVPGHKE